MLLHSRKLLAVVMLLLVTAVVVTGCKGVQDKKRNDVTYPAVTGLTHTWGTISDQQTQIKSKAVIKNPYPFAIVLKTVNWELDLGDNTVMQGVVTKNQELPSGNETDINFEAIIDNAKLNQLWAIHLRNKEHTTFSYQGTMNFDLKAGEYKYDFKQSYEVKTNLLGQKSQ